MQEYSYLGGYFDWAGNHRGIPEAAIHWRNTCYWLKLASCDISIFFILLIPAMDDWFNTVHWKIVVPPCVQAHNNRIEFSSHPSNYRKYQITKNFSWDEETYWFLDRSVIFFFPEYLNFKYEPLTLRHLDPKRYISSSFYIELIFGSRNVDQWKKTA